MPYAWLIHPRNTHTTYNQNTPNLIGRCDVAMVTESNFKYANSNIKFSEFLFKKMYFCDPQDLRVQNYVNSHRIYQNKSKTVRRSIQ